MAVVYLDGDMVDGKSQTIPLIGMNDSAGAFVPAGVGGLDGYGPEALDRLLTAKLERAGL